MYAIGDKIVYPVYGAGIIENIETQQVDGELQRYYLLNIPVSNLKMMISVTKAEDLRVRHIHTKRDVIPMIQGAKDIEIKMPDNWNQRYKENMERIKTGEIAQVSSVFYNLLLRERERGLSTAEKKVMSTAKQVMLSEIILSHEIEKTEAEEMLEKVFS